MSKKVLEGNWINLVHRMIFIADEEKATLRCDTECDSSFSVISHKTDGGTSAPLGLLVSQ